MQLSVHGGDATERSAVTIRCLGELDLATAPALMSCVEAQVKHGRKSVRLDVAGLCFCDARGLTALLEIRRSLTANGGGLVLVNPPPTLRRTLTLTGLDRALRTVADVIPLPRSI